MRSLSKTPLPFMKRILHQIFPIVNTLHKKSFIALCRLTICRFWDIIPAVSKGVHKGMGCAIFPVNAFVLCIAPLRIALCGASYFSAAPPDKKKVEKPLRMWYSHYKSRAEYRQLREMNATISNRKQVIL